MAAGTLAAVARTRSGLRVIVARLRRVSPRRRTPRTRRAAQRQAPAANDDDRPRALAA